jgi:hypothetical protein
VKSDFSCELVRRGGVGVELSVPWPSRWSEGPRHQGDDSVAWWRARARSGALERGTARQDVEDQERPGGRWMTAPQ